ncbi:MAG: hypothetical protein ABGY11_04080 [Candidatus Thioglobus sp.]|jgi:hypothetical protein
MSKVKWKEGMTMVEYERLIKEEQYSKWASKMESILTPIVIEDLASSGQYLDDEIGDQDFNNAVAEVVESQTKGQWDYYNNTIGDTVTELLGSDFINTI